VNRTANWLGILAIALQALWPLIAQARPKDVVLVPVCTVEGVTHYMELPGGRTPLDDSANSHQEHCAYCFPALQTQAPLLLEAQQSLQGVESVDTQCDSRASILIMDARGPPSSPLATSVQQPRREDAQVHGFGRRPGALAAAASGGFMRIGVLLG
jgi:hypothetical protein